MRFHASLLIDFITHPFRFLPKRLSVRTIMKFSHGKAETHKLKQVKAILDYLTAVKPSSLAFGVNGELCKSHFSWCILLKMTHSFPY